MKTKSVRKSISTKRRFELFKRDGFACQYCGAHPPGVLLEIDHIVAVADGGGNDDDNLTTACWNCNSGKGARALTDIPVSLEDKAREICEREAQIKGYHDVMEGKRQRLDDDMWNVATVYMDHFGMERISKDALQSIKMFVDKLGFHEVADAMDLAIAKRSQSWAQQHCFRYFCGICWNKVKGTKKDA